MAAVEVFYFEKITNAQYRPIEAGVPGTALELGCTGSLSGETEVRVKRVLCEGDPIKKKAKPSMMTVTFTGHIKVAPFRKLFGLSTEGLKAGVYGYGENSNPIPGIFTFEIEEFDGVEKKVIAFPNMSNASGLSFNFANGEEDVAEVEISFEAMKDENGYLYYEAIASEVTDETVVDGWATTFTPALVEVTAP